MIEKFSIKCPNFTVDRAQHREHKRGKSAEKKTNLQNQQELKSGDFGSDYLVHIMPKI